MSPAARTRAPEEARDLADRMAIFLSRFIRDGEIVFHGVASPLPMAAIALARRTHAPNLTYLNIPGGVNPRPSYLPGSTVARQLMEGALSYFSLAEIFDLSARGGLDLAFLGGAQIDARGDVNLSFIGEPAAPRVRLPGGAGSAHILPTARRTVLWRTAHDARTFPARCDYVTASGNVAGVVTPLCVFRKAEGRLRAASIHAGVRPDALRAATGFDLGNLDVPETPEPTAAERAALEAADPECVRLREFA